MTETLPKHRALQAGFRAHLTKLLEKAATLVDKEMPSKVELVSLKNILEQLARKRDISKIWMKGSPHCSKNQMKSRKKTEDIQDSIDETSSQISSFLDLVSSKKTISTVPLNTTGKSPLHHENSSEQVASGSHDHQPPQPETSSPQVNGLSGLPFKPQGTTNEISQVSPKLFKTLHKYSHHNKIYPCPP